MPAQRKQREQPENDNEGLGLMANGSSGAWAVAVDETTKGPDRWFVQLEGPSIYFSFEVPSPDMISKALDFLGGHSSPPGPHAGFSAENGSLVLGKHRQTRVILVRDDEYRDRYFLVVEQEADLVVRFTIAGKDLKDIHEALRQATEDLEDDGYGTPVDDKQMGGSKVMSILPTLTAEDRSMLTRPIERTEDQGTYVRCDHKDGGISYWRFLRPENLVKLGDYKPWTWVVVVVDGPEIPREGYPMEEGEVPQTVRALRR